MAIDHLVFEQAYGRVVPPALKSLYDDSKLLANTPLDINLPGKLFVVEIQYFQGLTEFIAEDVARQQFVFAVSSDGFDMLVDLNEPDLPVLQREFGRTDHLDFTLVEFLAVAKLQRMI